MKPGDVVRRKPKRGRPAGAPLGRVESIHHAIARVRPSHRSPLASSWPIRLLEVVPDGTPPPAGEMVPKPPEPDGY